MENESMNNSNLIPLSRITYKGINPTKNCSTLI